MSVAVASGGEGEESKPLCAVVRTALKEAVKSLPKKDFTSLESGLIASSAASENEVYVNHPLALRQPAES
jgi:hypothetical protein